MNLSPTIDDGRVPIKRVQLNSLTKDMSDVKTLPTFWNSRGRVEIMPLQELRDSFDVHTQRQGNGWANADMMNALIQKMEEKLEAAGCKVNYY